MKIHNMKQGSPEWLEVRRGKITGTGFKKVLSKRGNTRMDYMRELALERKTGISSEGYCNETMEWGIATEPQARAYFEKEFDVKVEQVGFIESTLPDFENYVGVSPDGLVLSDRTIEIKCPNTETHLKYMAQNRLPSEYEPQVQGILWVTEREWCTFISFDPRCKEQPFWSIQVKRDETYIANLANEVDKFITEMVQIQKTLKDVDPQLLIDVTQDGQIESDWVKARQMEIKGKVRHGVVCAMIQSGNKIPLNEKEHIDRIVDYIMTGE